MYYMPVLRVRRVGNSLGVVFPKDLVAEKELHLNDNITVEVRKAMTLEETFGSFTETDLSVEELLAIVDEGEDL